MDVGGEGVLTNLQNKNHIMKIIQCLEDERTFYEIAADILKFVEEYLNTSHAYILKKNAEKENYQIIIKYDCNDRYDDSSSIEISHLEMCKEELVYAENADGKYAGELAFLDAACGVGAPVYVNNGSAVMHLLLLNREHRVFNETELEYVANVSLILQQIAHKKVSNRSLISTNGVLRSILTNIGSGILVFDARQKTMLFRNTMGETSEEHIRVLTDAMMSIMEDDDILIPKRPVEFFDAESGLWFDVSFSRLEWIDGREAVLLSSNDTTLKKKNSTRSVFQAHNDFLTGLFNRMKCEIDLKKLVEQVENTGQRGAVLFIDLDNFKNINDSLGHDYGDALLKQIGATLQGITGLRNHCYRMGGDEFIAIVTPENYDLLKKILTNITTAFNRPWYLLDSECYCTMSMGVVIFPENGLDVNSLIKKADIAMYEAKRSGKNRYAYYSEEANEDSYRRLEVESNMRQAVEASCEEFVVFYQPIIDTKSNRCTGCESLVRWNSKSLGFMAPGEFIPLAEYLGLITDIGDFVLEKACQQCREWNKLYDPDFGVNVNLSVVQLLQPDVVNHISEIISSTGVNPKNITLEITENLAINDIERVTGIINGLKEFGVKIALDDFGTGYSSLNYIKQLNFDVIKIDKSFVDEILTDDYEKAFVKLIVDLSAQIGVKLCVEGIESKEQYELLKSLKADAIQGYYFSKPIPAADFTQRFLR